MGIGYFFVSYVLVVLVAALLPLILIFLIKPKLTDQPTPYTHLRSRILGINIVNDNHGGEVTWKFCWRTALKHYVVLVMFYLVVSLFYHFTVFSWLHMKWKLAHIIFYTISGLFAFPAFWFIGKGNTVVDNFIQLARECRKFFFFLFFISSVCIDFGFTSALLSKCAGLNEMLLGNCVRTIYLLIFT